MFCDRKEKEYPPLDIVAGDDYTYRVNFKNPEEPQESIFTDGDAVQMTFGFTKTEVTINGEIQGNTGIFYLSTQNTMALDALNEPFLRYNVHILWANGGRDTPICNGLVRMKRCYHAEPEND